MPAAMAVSSVTAALFRMILIARLPLNSPDMVCYPPMFDNSGPQKIHVSTDEQVMPASESSELMRGVERGRSCRPSALLTCALVVREKALDRRASVLIVCGDRGAALSRPGRFIS